MAITIAGRPVGPVGFGMISLLMPGKGVTTEDAIITLKAAYDAGATYWNAGLIYGTPEHNSLHLLNAYFTKYPEDAKNVFISIKGCFDPRTATPRNDAENVKAEIERALQILDSKAQIGLFQAARSDPEVPIETTVAAIAEYVKAGKVGGVGLSECGAATIRKAVAVYPIAAVEVELSLFSTTVTTNGVTDACKVFDIPIVAYSPLSRGFLSGELRSLDDMAENDFRRMFPRFQLDVFDNNLRLVKEIEKIAEQKGCTSAQVAISWVSAHTQSLGVPVIPIPGTASVARVHENTKLIELTSQELKELSGILKKIEVKGSRYPARFEKHLEN